MPFNLSMIDLNLVLWILGILVVLVIIFGIFRFFFSHLLHLFFRGCGVVLFLVIVYVILRVLRIL